MNDSAQPVSYFGSLNPRGTLVLFVAGFLVAPNAESVADVSSYALPPDPSPFARPLLPCDEVVRDGN